MAGRFYSGQPKSKINSENLPFLKEFLIKRIFSSRYLKSYVLLGRNLRFHVCTYIITLILRDSPNL